MTYRIKGSFVFTLMSLVFLSVTAVVHAQPVISHLSNTSSARSGRLLIHGTNFGSQQDGGQVSIDGFSSIVTTWTDTEIIAYVPESAGLGATTVTVETIAGVSNAEALDVTLRQSEGRFRWRFQMDFRSSGAWTAIATDGTIYCSDPFRLYALSPDGALLWSIPDAGGERPISLAADGTIYTATNLAAGEIEGVMALHPDGSTRWVYIPEVSGGFGVDLLAGPSVGPDGNIYAASNTNLGGPGTFSLDPNGNLRWTSPEPGSNGITNYEILFDSNQVYVPLWGQGGGPEILTYDVDGDLLWTTGDLGLAIGSAPEIDPFGRLIMQWALIGVQALNPDGSLQWIYDPPGRMGNVVGPTVGPDGTIYSGTWGGGDLFAINPDGTTKWIVEDQISGFLWHLVVSPDNSTLIDGGAPDFGQPSTIRGFDTVDGSPLWSQSFHFENGLNEFAAWIEPNFSHDGKTIYVNTEFSSDTQPANLYAVDITPEGSSSLPNNFDVGIGSVSSGGLQELMQSDDQFLVMDPIFQTFRYQLSFTVDAISPIDSPSALDFKIESKTFNLVGTVNQRIELFNYVTERFEQIDLRTTTPTETLVTVTPDGDPSRFVEVGTGAMKARISQENNPAFWMFTFSGQFLPFKTSTDYVSWTMTP